MTERSTAHPTWESSINEKVERIALTEEPVLISGEAGTGKYVVAQAVHNQGTRHHKPFVRVECATAPDRLEIELFGFSRSPEPGALQTRPGILHATVSGCQLIEYF